ncbi:response regulator [Legionella parisiensis]|uniref:Chemotaxis protein CheY n=1 Tax=Legionella parisiensis TaxID=45071 RepID=A0A1E5JPZ1_9GAMM|nr:response regulator [Legionella parisiensis]KTD42914.1 two-component response regulator [Legionella parisiensis]OEH46606.1 Chemotaxis protein CheY [Legionella parisiensis]STX78012.1 two-component response regulator [Legionella parisiensis]
MEFQENIVDILYIEDDIVDVEGVMRIFKKVKESCAIEVASNGEEALNKLYGLEGQNKIHPKVILLDINVPKMNGIDLLKIIRKDPSLAFTEVFILTNAYTKEDKLAIKDLNVRGQIIKPLEYGDALNIYWATHHA